jgi:hypothetical protein
VTWSNTGTLVIVGVGKDGIAVASDGKMCPPGGTKCKAVEKIFPFGQKGAVGFVGNVTGEVRRGDDLIASIDVLKITKDLSPKTADMDVEGAFDAIISAVGDKLEAFMAQVPDSEQGSTKPIFRIVVAGYSSNGPIVWWAKFYGKNRERDSHHLVDQKRDSVKPGDLFTSGKWLVSEELLQANADLLRIFNNEPPAVRVRDAISTGKRSSLTSQDFLEWSDVCLRATESPEGQNYDQDPAVVGPPNRFGVITSSAGLRWVEAPAQKPAVSP